MSYDLAVWHTPNRLTDAEASALYRVLGESRTDGTAPHPAVDAFYAELTARYPELDTVPDELIDDSDYCPWSCALGRSPGSVVLSCVWSQAEAVGSSGISRQNTGSRCSTRKRGRYTTPAVSQGRLPD
jgi:hypothetical protein